nr:MAG: hypothetical protein [Marsupenaeus japonicus pemonivirus]
MGALQSSRRPSTLIPGPRVPTLRFAALVTVVDITVNCITRIFLTKSKDEMKTKLDMLKYYISDIPLTVLEDYVDRLESYWHRVHSDLPTDMGSFIMEIMLSPGLTQFHARKWMIGMDIDLYGMISHCTTLRTLSLHRVPVCHADVDCLNNTFRSLRHLQLLYLIPLEEGCSFHWAIGPVAQYCRDLRELRIVYDGNALSEETRGIEHLSQCRTLESLWLFDTSNYADPQIDVVCCLLKELLGLKFFFHRHMIQAILKLREDGETRKLALERLDTWLEKFHLDISSSEIRIEPLGVPMHKAVLCPSSLMSLVDSCPNVKSITLGRPPIRIDEVARTLPRIRKLKLFEFELFTCKLGDTLSKEGLLRYLTVLGLTEVTGVNYDLFSSLAIACPDLEVLNISRSCISREGSLRMPDVQNVALPHLRELKLTRRVDIRISEGLSTFSGDWHVGKVLLSYLLAGALDIRKLHVQFDEIQLEESDVPSHDYLMEMILPLKHLSHLHLMNPPDYNRVFASLLRRREPLLRFVVENVKAV